MGEKIKGVHRHGNEQCEMYPSPHDGRTPLMSLKNRKKPGPLALEPLSENRGPELTARGPRPGSRSPKHTAPVVIPRPAPTYACRFSKIAEMPSPPATQRVTRPYLAPVRSIS